MTTNPTTALTPAPAPATPPGPARTATRSLAPDLARGLMLLLIAVANVWGYLEGRALGPGHRPLDGTALDRLVDGVVAFLVDDRARPMFAVLFGFGMAMMAGRLAARGADEPTVRGVLRRRSLWLVALGVLHAALLFIGDILAPYGATGLVALAFVTRPDRVLRRWFWGSTALVLVTGVAFRWLTLGADVGPEPTADYLASVPGRLVGVGVNIGAAAVLLAFVPLVVVGIVLYRAGWITDPGAHRAQLRRTALAALAVNLVANLPWALVVARVLPEPDPGVFLAVQLAHDVSGMVMGVGYVCLFAWAAAALGERVRSAPARAVVATGERSLTSYLLQSVMFAPLLSAWGLGLGQRLGTAQATALAVGVWAVTVLVAATLADQGRRGPFEAWLRRRTYGVGNADARPAGWRDGRPEQVVRA
jgi:uncharacterized protein